MKKMKKNYPLFLLGILTSLTLLGGCQTSDKPKVTDDVKETALVTTITAEEAKTMLDTEDVILVDVRTQEEFDAGYIEGAILLPDYDIEAKAESLLTDKDATILIYCRSGRRSAAAAEKLVDMGYQNIYDMGGIIDWPYDIVVTK